MNTFQIILLAIALVFNSWMYYVKTGIALKKETLLRKMGYSGILFSVQFIITGTGIWIGYKISSQEIKTNMVIGLIILLVLGLKILLSGIKNQAEQNPFDLTDTKTVVFTALAEGLTPFATGMVIGLLSRDPYLHWIVTGAFLLSGIVTAQFISKLVGPRLLKLNLGLISSLLLLAASFKMILSLTDF